MFWGESAHSETTQSTPTPTLITSVRAYSNRELLVFGQQWPRGAPAATDQPQDGAIIAPFPTLSTMGSNTELNFLQFGGCQLANTFTGRWTNSSSIPSGPKLGVPLQLYSSSLRSVVLGPGGNWLTAMNAGGNYSLGSGIKSSVNVLPPGFTHETFISGGTGINNTLVEYGSALLTRSGKARPNPQNDFVLSHLGYWTDNGWYIPKSVRFKHDVWSKPVSKSQVHSMIHPM